MLVKCSTPLKYQLMWFAFGIRAIHPDIWVSRFFWKGTMLVPVEDKTSSSHNLHLVKGLCFWTSENTKSRLLVVLGQMMKEEDGRKPISVTLSLSLWGEVLSPGGNLSHLAQSTVLWVSRLHTRAFRLQVPLPFLMSPFPDLLLYIDLILYTLNRNKIFCVRSEEQKFCYWTIGHVFPIFQVLTSSKSESYWAEREGTVDISKPPHLYKPPPRKRTGKVGDGLNFCSVSKSVEVFTQFQNAPIM